MMWGFGNGYGSGWGMGLHSFLWWPLLIVAIVLIARAGWPGRSGRDPRGGSALEILKARYARGEIGKDEFEQKRRDVE